MSNQKWQQIVWICFFAAFPSGVFAADGVILIDQNSAISGNLTPGDAPGFPITISQSGSYRLNGNIAVPDADTTAIQITANFVTLDLNGFSITGPAVCTTHPTMCPAPGLGIGIQAGGDSPIGPRGVRILNGSVVGLGNLGILMTGDGSFVDKVTVDSNPGGGMHIAGTVLQSVATQNGPFGIFGITVRDSTAAQNFGDGIILDAVGGVATGNVSIHNGGYGFLIPFGTATGNSAFLNNSFGISAICPSSITGNTIVATQTGSIETRGDGCVQSNNATRQ